MGTNMSALLGACLVKCRWRTRLRVSERHQQLCEEKQSVPCGFWGRSNTATTATNCWLNLLTANKDPTKTNWPWRRHWSALFCLVSSCTLAPGMATVGASSTARRVSRVKRVSRETMMKPTDPTDPTAHKMSHGRVAQRQHLCVQCSRGSAVAPSEQHQDGRPAWHGREQLELREIVRLLVLWCTVALDPHISLHYPLLNI